VVGGFVLTTSCKPVARAKIDFWQADDKGNYDNVGYKYRGHQYTDANGQFYLETVLPGLYPGRTRHIHVKVQAPNQPVLTTQIYFPGEPGNARDSIYRKELEVKMQDVQGVKQATFSFVLNLA
jgi:protocatechuate 3,4-dioxygenase beta subunit